MWYVVLMIANYFHDLAVAVLAANILVVYFLGKYFDRRKIKSDFMPDLFRKLSRVTYGALTVVILGGAVRAYFFMDFEWSCAVGDGQIAALVVKHVILIGVAIFGLVGHFRYQRRYGTKSA
jgi:hypothetical protein